MKDKNKQIKSLSWLKPLQLLKSMHNQAQRSEGKGIMEQNPKIRPLEPKGGQKTTKYLEGPLNNVNHNKLHEQGL